jgi:hypothetical protein
MELFMEQKYGFIYIWRDRKHNRYYIGSHWGTVDDGYICSSTWMMQAYKKRPQDFKRKILEIVTTNRKDLLDCELKWLSYIKEDEIKTKYYNLNIKGTGHWTAYPENIQTIKEKISYKTKEAMARPEVKQKFNEGLKTRDSKSSDPQVRKKRSESMKKAMAEKFPVEQRADYNRVKFNSDEYKENMKEKSKNMWANRTDEEKDLIGNKISMANKGFKHRLGQTNNELHRKRISESMKGVNSKRIVANGIEFKSIADAVQSLNVSRSTVDRKLKSNKFDNWYYR